MKKIVFFCFMLIATTTVLSQSLIQGYQSIPSKSENDHNCDFDKCLAHCINHKKICSIWDRDGIMSIYHKVYAMNKSFTIFDKIKIGSHVTFPPFGRGNQAIGTKTVLTVQKNEDIWALIHRYKAENYLFNLDLGYRRIDDEWAKKNNTKELAFYGTMIYW